MDYRTYLNAFAFAVARYNQLWATVDEWPAEEYEEREAELDRLRKQAEKFRGRVDQIIDAVDRSEKVHDGLAYVRPIGRGICLGEDLNDQLEDILPEGYCNLIVYRSQIEEAEIGTV